MRWFPGHSRSKLILESRTASSPCFGTCQGWRIPTCTPSALHWPLTHFSVCDPVSACSKSGEIPELNPFGPNHYFNNMGFIRDYPGICVHELVFTIGEPRGWYRPKILNRSLDGSLCDTGGVAYLVFRRTNNSERLTGVAYCLSTPQSRLAGKNSPTTPFNWDLKSWIQQHSDPSIILLLAILFTSPPTRLRVGVKITSLIDQQNHRSATTEFHSENYYLGKISKTGYEPFQSGPSVAWNLRVTCRNPSL